VCFGLDLLQVSSSEEENEKLSAFGVNQPVDYSVLQSSSNSVSEEDPSSFAGAKASSISA